MHKQKPKIEISKNQDHLEAYPEKKQVSAFPERRFIKTNRFLVIFTLINLALLLAGSGIFIYSAQRVSVRVQNRQGILLYQLDREEKRLKQAEYSEKKVSARQMIMESFLKQYITERNSANGTLVDFSYKFNKNSLVFKSSALFLHKKIESDLDKLRNEVWQRNRFRDVHVYNLHPLNNSLTFWTAVMETFDFLKPDIQPICNCFDNSQKCLKCKNEHTLLRQRRRIWIRTSFNKTKTWIRTKPDEIKETSQDNPFGVYIEGYYEGYMPKDASYKNWDLPTELM